jgi:transcription elongation factor S-II
MDIRSKVCTNLKKIVGSSIPDGLVQNMEKSIYNWNIKQAIMYRDVPSWENHTFKQRYLNKVSSISFNLKSTESKLIERIVSGEIKSKDIAKLSPVELWPNGLWHQTEVRLKEKQMIIDKVNALADEDYIGLYQCSKCKSMKTTYYQLQTRSADEPMTTFVTCVNCGKRWKC